MTDFNRWGAYSAPWDPLAGFGGPLRGRGGAGLGKGRKGKWRGRKGRTPSYCWTRAPQSLATPLLKLVLTIVCCSRRMKTDWMIDERTAGSGSIWVVVIPLISRRFHMFLIGFTRISGSSGVGRPVQEAAAPFAPPPIHGEDNNQRQVCTE